MKNMKKHNESMRASEYLQEQQRKTELLILGVALLFIGVILIGFSKISNEPMVLQSSISQANEIQGVNN